MSNSKEGVSKSVGKRNMLAMCTSEFPTTMLGNIIMISIYLIMVELTVGKTKLQSTLDCIRSNFLNHYLVVHSTFQ